MGRTSIEDRFADLSQWAAPTFHPAQLPEVSRRAKRRRLRRRAFVSATIAVLVALPTWAFAVTARNRSEPIIGPTALPKSPTWSTPGVSTRKVQVPGVSPGQQIQVQMVDKDHGWLSAGCESARNQTECRFVLARTQDRGRVWYSIPYPEAVPKQGVEIRPLDEVNLLIVDPKQGIWRTINGGKTFSFHAFNAAPIENTLWVDGRYQMQCTNRDCKRKRLVRTGLGPTDGQPPWDSADTRVLATGADGRIWLSHPGGLAVSADEGKTWQETGLANVTELWLSPNGYRGYTRVNAVRWHLTDTAWTVLELPETMRFSNVVLPLNDGKLFVGDSPAIGYFDDGVITEVPGLVGAQPVGQLRDGTIVLHHVGPNGETGIYLGVPDGTATEWTLLTY